MDFKYSDEAEAFRGEFRTWLEANHTTPTQPPTRTTTSAAKSSAPTRTTGNSPSTGIAR